MRALCPYRGDVNLAKYKGMTDKKCPKCGSCNYQIADEYTTTYLYEVIDGIVVADGEDNDFGKRVRTTCTCYKCGHHWHPRRFRYVIDE